jgi:hypothetical protein
MYVEQAAIDRSSLFQGDILVDIQLFGVITLSSISFTMDNQGAKNGWIVPQKPDFGAAMVLSHSCEIDRSNLVKVTSIILAPLRDLNKITKPEKITEIIQSNDIGQGTTYSYLKYYYIPGLDMIGFPDGAVVDFSKCFSIRNKSYDLLLQQKRAQLIEQSADSMARKLALYFYRTNATV